MSHVLSGFMVESFRVKNGAAPRLILLEYMSMGRVNMAFVAQIVTPVYLLLPSYQDLVSIPSLELLS